MPFNSGMIIGDTPAGDTTLQTQIAQLTKDLKAANDKLAEHAKLVEARDAENLRLKQEHKAMGDEMGQLKEFVVDLNTRIENDPIAVANGMLDYARKKGLAVPDNNGKPPKGKPPKGADVDGEEPTPPAAAEDPRVEKLMETVNKLVQTNESLGREIKDLKGRHLDQQHRDVNRELSSMVDTKMQASKKKFKNDQQRNRYLRNLREEMLARKDEKLGLDKILDDLSGDYQFDDLSEPPPPKSKDQEVIDEILKLNTREGSPSGSADVGGDPRKEPEVTLENLDEVIEQRAHKNLALMNRFASAQTAGLDSGGVS